MNTEERVKHAVRAMDQMGLGRDFQTYLENLKEQDSLAFSVVEIYIHSRRHQHSSVISKGLNLLRKLSGKQRLAWRVLILIGGAYRGMGEMDTAESYFLRALETAESMGDKKASVQTRFQLYATRFFKAEYQQAQKDLLNYKKDPDAWQPLMADYFLGVYQLVMGYPDKAIGILDSFLKSSEKNLSYFGALEMKGLSLRVMGRFSQAMQAFLNSAQLCAEYNTAYMAFPVAKALQLSKMASLEPPPQKMVKKALSLSRKGSWGERAAASEIQALLSGTDAQTAQGLFEASRNYLRAHQNIEAVLSGFTAAYLAWNVDSPVFVKVLKMIAPLVPLHPGFKKDRLLGDFISETEPFLRKFLRGQQGQQGIRAYLIGQFKVLVDGKEIKLTGWWRKSAIRAFVYLLLSSKHRMPDDHLFYLLWPRRNYNKKSRWLVYKAISTIRAQLGRAELLTKTRDFYQLNDVWTDLEELENLVRLADATDDPVQKEEYLSRARELARGELLPEFPYDRHIDEYRQHYKRLRKKLGLK